MALEYVNHGLSGIPLDRLPVTVNDGADNTGGKQAKARIYFAKDGSKGIELTLQEPHGTAGNHYRIEVDASDTVAANAVDVDKAKQVVKISVRFLRGTGAAQIKSLIDTQDELTSDYFGGTGANDNLHEFTVDDFAPEEARQFAGGEDTPCIGIKVTTAGAVSYRTLAGGNANRTETFAAGETVMGRFTRIRSTGTAAGRQPVRGL